MILSARGFSYRIKGNYLLRRVSFSVAAGERFAIIGPNGAGKTTLLKCLLRLLPPGEGELAVAGKALSRYRQKKLAQILSYVPQALSCSTNFTVFEFILLARYPHLSPFTTLRTHDCSRVREVLHLTELEAFAGRALSSLSGGELQKTMIAAALAQEAQVMLLDEPAAFLDPYQQEVVYALLEKIHASTQTTLVEVTHDINRAVLGCDRILALRAGQVVFTGTPGELMRPEILREIYGKIFQLGQHPANGRLIVMPEASPCR